ncbi:radiation-inducible immediate-early gene IEX-1-like [Hemiscyllium ocellatum]|uniref:radiation-inducible immediate-early gene IEX-1-like n=1 Tax=Hemiscyllium ocellatum TaxID=170820 RepID=UPI0029668CFE|nr:radiation-inducible immediate-early gene IEX-1-like [Hemiscyllium ocellatum]
MCLARPCAAVQGHTPAGAPGGKARPLVFTFEPIPERGSQLRPPRRRAARVLYPPHQVRKPVVPRPDAAKRLFLFFISVVLFQVYTATEDEGPVLPVTEPWTSTVCPALPPAFHAASPRAGKAAAAPAASPRLGPALSTVSPRGAYPVTLMVVYTTSGYSRK